jgi:hypothetical protein
MSYQKTAATPAAPSPNPNAPILAVTDRPTDYPAGAREENVDAAMVRELSDISRRAWGQSGHLVYTLDDNVVSAFLTAHGVKPVVPHSEHMAMHGLKPSGTGPHPTYPANPAPEWTTDPNGREYPTGRTLPHRDAVQ